jgi:hypothetical protein
MSAAVQEVALRDAVSPGALAGERMLPVLPALEDLFPGGGLRRGSTLAVGRAVLEGAALPIRAVTGSTSLALAVLAGPSAAGSWCAVVGLPSLGVIAAAEAGLALQRLALVPDPGPAWPTVTAALLEALDVVAVRPPGRLRAADARRLMARARERSAVLVALGAWEGADLRLAVKGGRWMGLGNGHGHLRARLVDVMVEGRGVAAKPRRVEVWLPGEPGLGTAAPSLGSITPPHEV